MGTADSEGASGVWAKIQETVLAHPSVPAGVVAVPDRYIVEAADDVVALIAGMDERIPADAKPFLMWGIEHEGGGNLILSIGFDFCTGFNTPARNFSAEAGAALNELADRFQKANERRVFEDPTPLSDTEKREAVCKRVNDALAADANK